MEKSFENHRYPDVYEREKLSARTGLPEDRIQVNYLCPIFSKIFKFIKSKIFDFFKKSCFNNKSS